MIMFFITYLSNELRVKSLSGPMRDAVPEARRFYADELKFATAMRLGALHAAFATAPRERSLGPGPWRIKMRSDRS
jgi:hypothetical protein